MGAGSSIHGQEFIVNISSNNSNTSTSSIWDKPLPSAAKVSIATVAKTREGWSSFRFNLKNFKGLTLAENRYVDTPEFSCNGHDWVLRIYPGGKFVKYVSIFLYHRSEGSITADFELMVIDKFGNKNMAFPSHARSFGSMNHICLIKYSDLLDDSQNILDSNDTLTIIVSMKEEKPTTVFIPPNPSDCMELNDNKADVSFVISSSTLVNDHGRRKRAKASIYLHAHSCILQKYAPMLAGLFQNDEEVANITDVDPKVFYLLLSYVYGESVNWEENKSLAKDVIEAADKYEIVSLKIEAEAAYVQSTMITADNAIDNLLYADSKNCSLLMEAVFHFIAQNREEVEEKFSVDDIPEHLARDILVVNCFGRH